MPGWDALLPQLAEVPRENGTPGIHHAATFLFETLDRAGLEPELIAFDAHPHALRLAGILTLAGCLLYFRLMRSQRYGAALAVALASPLLLLAELDFGVPVFGWIGAHEQHHVRVVIPAEQSEQRLIIAAHYDTKTDLLDHVERAPIEGLALPVIPLMVLAAAAGLFARRDEVDRPWRRRLMSVASIVSAGFGIAMFAALSAGAFVPSRSPGAIDDGASCAVMVRLAAALAAAPPPARTDVEFLWLSAEEVGVQGSDVYARARFTDPPSIPTAMLNLEGLGVSADHAVLRAEGFTLRSFEPGEVLVARLDRAYRDERDRPLPLTPFGGATDARSFLARGIPAATLITRPTSGLVTRGLHSSDDDRSRLDEDALDVSLAVLLRTVRVVDEEGL